MWLIMGLPRFSTAAPSPAGGHSGGCLTRLNHRFRRIKAVGLNWAFCHRRPSGRAVGGAEPRLTGQRLEGKRASGTKFQRLEGPTPRLYCAFAIKLCPDEVTTLWKSCAGCSSCCAEK
jgi:hypothetical protein